MTLFSTSTYAQILVPRVVGMCYNNIISIAAKKVGSFYFVSA